MLIGALLGIAWLVLLIRYPARALPISLGAVLGLSLIGSWIVWQDQRVAERLAHLNLRLDYRPGECPPDRPLHVRLLNDAGAPLRTLEWQVAAYAPGDDLDLARRPFDAPRYQGPGDLQPGEVWESCMPLPELRPGYRPRTLAFRAQRLEGRFAD